MADRGQPPDEFCCGRDRVRFRRGLSDSFVTELNTGRFHELLEATKSRCLDLQIRESYADI